MAMVMAMRERVEQMLHEAFDLKAAQPPVEVIDESHLHAGHAGAPAGGESHFRLLLPAKAFADHSRVSRERAVTKAIQPLIDGGIHAIAVEFR